MEAGWRVSGKAAGCALKPTAEAQKRREKTQEAQNRERAIAFPQPLKTIFALKYIENPKTGMVL